MPDCICPLKEAAREAPSQTICGLTYSELDALADRTTPIQTPCRLPTGPEFLAHLFAAIRRGIPFFPVNPCIPNIPSINPSSPIALLTSGTTAKPKIACFTLQNFLTNAQGVNELLQLNANHCWLLSLPLHHVGGLAILFRCLLARASITHDPRTPHITHLSYVPTQLYRAWPLYKNLQAILVGGAPIYHTPPQLPIIATYGLTEMSSTVLAQHKPPLPFLGFPLKNREIKLASDGEIYVRGPCLFQGYANEPPTTDWFPTKDIGRFDPQLGYAIIGRKDNQFISGGENIQPEEIEQELCSHPAVLQALVVPKPDLEYGARPIAYLQTLDPHFDLNTMRAFLADRLPKYKIPIALFISKQELYCDRSERVKNAKEVP